MYKQTSIRVNICEIMVFIIKFVKGGESIIGYYYYYKV